MIYNKENRAYRDAKQRCNNPKHKRYRDWGGRGIQMLFTSFAEFLEEIGPRPDGKSLDRINNDLSYQKGNVKWSSRTEQQHNKRRSKRNHSGICGVRQVKSKGLVATTYQAHINIDNKFYQLYTGPDFFLACCARKSIDASIARHKDLI